MSKILVADDSPDNIELIRDIVGVLGHDVITAMDGPAALESARAEMPDLAILDVNMPGMTGFEVCAALKSDTQTSSIPVIMLTALSDVQNRVEGLSVGADDYLTKPYSPRELIARVNARLRVKAETDDLRQTKEMIRATIERYVASSVVDRLLQSPDSIELGGRLQDVTALFADLEGFTTLSEHTPPDKLLSILNAYHTLMVKIIQRYGGTIDKFLGDGLLALYNTPLEQEDHVERAVKSALHIQDEMYHFHQQFEPEYQIKINFGIHTGKAIVGNVGSENIMNFTAVGDTINVAARLQGISENGQILISSAVYKLVEEFAIARELGSLQVRGRKEPIIAYEISNTMF